MPDFQWQKNKHIKQKRGSPILLIVIGGLPQPSEPNEIFGQPRHGYMSNKSEVCYRGNPMAHSEVCT